jgi:hypothetical protein
MYSDHTGLNALMQLKHWLSAKLFAILYAAVLRRKAVSATLVV